MKRKLVGLLLMFLLCGPSLFAQHTHLAKIVNGAEHPDQIADTDAYRHFLLQSDVNFLPIADRAKAVGILADFNAEWQDRIAEYNAFATVENNAGRSVDVQKFLDARDAFVWATLDKLRDGVSPIAMKVILERVQQRKGRMYISAPSESASNIKKPKLVPASYRQGPPQGQCTGATYQTTLVGSNSETITTALSAIPPPATVQVQFTTTIDGAVQNMVGSPVGCNLNTFGVLHTPHLSQSINGVWYYANPAGVCENCYIHSTLNTLVAVSTAPGSRVPMESKTTVVCSFGGTFFTWDWPTFGHFALTLSETVGGAALGWLVISYCTPATTPPDFNPSLAVLQNYSPFFFGDSFCTAPLLGGHTWVCPLGFDYAWHSTNVPYACTYTPLP